MLGISGGSEEDLNDSQPSTSSNCALDVEGKISTTKPTIGQGIVLANQSTIFKQMIAMHPKTNESEYCAYLHRVCLQPRIEGYLYCNRHILYDKNAPFKQCSFQHPQSQKRCPYSACKLDRHDSKVLCDEHINYKPVNKGLENFKQQFSVPESSENTTVSNASYSSLSASQKLKIQQESLKRKFELLEHYCPNESHSKTGERIAKKDWEINPDDKSIIMHRSFKEKKLEAFCKVLYGGRKSFSDPMKIQVNQITNQDDFEQDTMSWLSNDPLRFAGHLSIGDIENSLQDKFVKIKHLQMTLAKTRPEIVNLQTELKMLRNQEKTGNVSSSFSTFQSSQNANGSSHCKNKLDSEHFSGTSSVSTVKIPVIVYGTENGNENMSEVSEFLETEDEKYERMYNVKDAGNICVYQKGQDKCTGQVLPLSRYCQKHILFDISQCLFRPCGAPLTGDPSAGSCLEPIVPYTSKRTCLEHVTLKYTKEDIGNYGMEKNELTDDKEDISDAKWEDFDD